MRNRITAPAALALIAVASFTPASLGQGLPGPGGTALSTSIDLSSKGNAPDSWIREFKITPRMLQSQDGSGGSLGIGYVLSSKPYADYNASDAIGSVASGNLTGRSFEMEVKGLVAAKAETNPERAVDATASGSYYMLRNGVFAKSAFSLAYSRQQGAGAEESRWEVSQALGAWLERANNIELLGRAALARVQPRDDPARKAALGGSLDSFRRWDVELMAIIPLTQTRALQGVELRHLRFHEIKPAAAIKSAGLHETKLSSVYFRLPKGMFVAYSKGGVPFDRKDSKILQLGWSTDAF